MPGKLKVTVLSLILVVLALLISAASGSWGKPLAQMDMPTNTVQPPSATLSGIATTQTTPVPIVPDQGSLSGAPTMTSIFTGYTPDLEVSSTYTGAMGGGVMGGCSGMSGSSTMGMGGMGGGTGTITNTLGMSGMGSGSMDMSGCPMMSGMGSDSSMSGMNMGSDSSMSGMNMDNDLSMIGMDMDAISGYAVEDSYSVFSNPWQLIGWVLLALIVIAVIAVVVLAIYFLIKRTRQIHPV